jgi:quercetin dioxygenase-like cupin family protein
MMVERKGAFERDPEIEHYFSDGVYAKRMFIPAGFEAGKHSHAFSHLSILAKGRAIVKTDIDQKEYFAPACLEIPAGVNHIITAIDDCEWFCIHATDESDVDKIDHVLIGRN